MKKAILIFLLRVFILLFVAMAAGVLDFVLIKLASLFDTKLQQDQNDFDLFERASVFIFFVGVPYLLYLIIFKLFRSKRTSIVITGIFTAILTSLLFVVIINTLTIGRPNMLDLDIFIRLIIFFIGGFSLPYVDDFFMRKFGLKESE